MKDVWIRQSERVTNISKALRKAYYKENENAESYFSTPSGGTSGNGEKYDMIGSIGAWPEFIMRGTFCCRTFKGYCSPCFYSQFSLKNKVIGDEYREMVKEQFSYVIENFDKEVYRRQYGWKYLDSAEERKIEFVLTPTGSYFDGNEFPQDLRIQMLKGICKASENYDEPVHMMVESHCEDWLALDFDNEKTKEEIALLQKLNATVLFGFESADEYVRNVLYNKHLELGEVERAYDLIKKHKLTMGVFVFAGLFSMNDYLTYEDVTASLEYAISRGIVPVIMFQNIQTNTINEILFKNNKISLIEPFTVMDIISKMVELCEKYKKNGWLIADPKGGPPTPEFNIFDCAVLTSPEYSDKIYNSVVTIRKTRNFKEYQDTAAKIRQTDEYKGFVKKYRELYRREELEEKTSELLNCAETILKDRGYT